MSGGGNTIEENVESTRRPNLHLSGFLVRESLKLALYFLSVVPILLVWNYVRPAHPVVLFLLLAASFYVAGVLFISLVVLAKRAVIGTLETNQVVTIQTSLGKRFFFASMLNAIAIHSPFKTLISGVSPFASCYYRGMGSKMASSVFISGSARISDPWFLEAEENVTIGGDALILGHAGNGREIILGTVFIGAGAIIGARAIILPNVRVGSRARVGAGAVVIRGTVIPDGETWAGVPARKIISRRDRGAI
jgi:acetyltransferase-like isoleucine patch superfamily enzyme